MKNKLRNIFNKSKSELFQNWDGRERLLRRIKSEVVNKKEDRKKVVLNFAYSMMMASILIAGIYQYQKINRPIFISENASYIDQKDELAVFLEYDISDNVYDYEYELVDYYEFL